ncbi:phosphomethylpyrimidine synthase ThiC, partial [bacterium]|nr:phosphomethylpyrimidine synthase ThiC [bacterium]
MTQREMAIKGDISAQMHVVAANEGLEPEKIRECLASGRLAIPANKAHKKLKPTGIGENLKTKVNANLGTSRDCPDMEEELIKLKAALDAGADTVMDLSTGGDLDRIRRAIIDASPIPVGTVPIYQAAIKAALDIGGVVHMGI